MQKRRRYSVAADCDFTRAGTDLIVIQRSYQGDSSPAVQRARKAGVVVVAIDADVPGGTDAVVKPDEAQGGKLAGEYVASKLPSGGKVAIANGPERSEALQLRVKGFTTELAKHQGIDVVENQDTGMSRDGTHRVVAEFLRLHPDLSAIYAVNDPVAFYSQEEALRAGRTNLFIVGMEGSPKSVTAMEDSHLLISASPSEDPFALGEMAVEQGAEILRSARRPAQAIVAPFTPLSRENVSSYIGWTR